MRALLDVKKTYTTNENNAVGPTTSQTLRSVTTHNDGNSIYIAPNGDDGTGDGTSALPFLTIDKAFSTLGGKFIVTAERNGYVGDMIFAAPDVINSVVLTLQVEEGEVATIKRSVLALRIVNSLTRDWFCSGYNNVSRYMVGVGAIATGFIYRSDDVISWTVINAGVMSTSRDWRGIAANGDTWIACANGHNIHYSTDNGITWSVDASVGGVRGWIDAGYGDNLFLACEITGGFIWYSSDGITWTQSNAESKPWSFVGYANGLYLAAASFGNIYSSTDGINWNLTNAPTKNWASITYGEGFYVALSSSGEIYNSHDLITWELVYFSAARQFKSVVYGDGNFYASGDPGVSFSLLTSTNGITWVDFGTTNRVWQKLTYGKGILIAPASQTNAVYGFYNTIIYMSFFGMTINGFYLDGSSTISNAIVGVATIGSEFKYLSTRNVVFNGIVNFDTPTVSQCLIKDLEGDGITECDGGTYTDNILLDIDGRGIHLTDGNPTISNNTLVNIKGFAIRLELAVAASTTLSKLIMAYCGGLIQSLNEVLTLDDSIATMVTGLSRVNIDSDTKLGIAPMFHDEGLDDYHIWHKEEGFPENSPAKTLGGGRDAGAYDVDFTLISTVITDLSISGKYLQFARNKIKVKPESGFTFLPDYKRSYLANRVRLALTAKESANEETYLNFEDMSEQDESMLIYPVDTGFFTPSTAGAFEWLNKSDQDGLIQLTADTADEAGIQTFIGDEWAEGWFVLIEQLGDGGSPEVFRDIAFKIAEWNEYGLFEVENLSANYPGTGLPALPDGDYDYKIVKAMALWRFEYTGQQTINGVVLDVFQAVDLYQQWRPRQWAGYLLGLDYTNGVGSKSFVYVQDSTEDTLFCLNVFGVSLSVMSPLTQYIAVLEAIFMKAEITDVSGNPVNPITELGKFGNDFWSTIFSRANSELASNTTGETINLIESTDYNEDLL